MSKRKLPSKAPSKKVMQLLAAEGWTPKVQNWRFSYCFEKQDTDPFQFLQVKKILKGTSKRDN